MQPRVNPMPESDVAKRLLDAASEVIERSGEASLRVQDIVEVAGVQAPVLYRHFGNREGLVQSAHLARFIREIAEEASVFSLLAGRATSKEEFRQHFNMLVQAAGDPSRVERRRARLEVLGSAVSRPELTELISKVQSTTYLDVVDSIIQAQERGWVRPEIDAATFVAWASSTMLGLAAVEHYGSIPDSTQWWIRYQAEACVALLFDED